MRDAFSGIFNIVFIAVFLLIVSGALAFSVGYIKAFRMKNAVISNIEKFEASKSCFEETSNEICRKNILEYAKSIGYSPDSTGKCGSMDEGPNGLFCYQCYDSTTNHHEEWYDDNKVKYCAVSTQVDIKIPIIRQIMSRDFFRVHGETRVIQISKN